MKKVSITLPVSIWELVAYALLSYAAQSKTSARTWEKIAKKILGQLNQSEVENK